MAWGKLIGGVIGAAMGGPVGAGLGVLIGAGLEGSENESTKGPGRIANPAAAGTLTLDQTGNVLTVTATVPSTVDANILQLRLKQGEEFLTSSVDLYADDEGNFRLIRDVNADPLSADIPLDVVSLPVGAPVDLHVVAVFFKNGKYAGHLVAPGRVRLSAEPWSDIRWLTPVVDLLAHYALRYGPWSASKVQRIKSVFSEYLELEGLEAELLRDRLKLSSRPGVEACVAVWLRRFGDGPLLVSLLKGIIDLLRLSGRDDETVTRELVSLGQKMQFEPGFVNYLLQAETEETQNSEVTSGREDVRWACKVLEVEVGASQEVIKQAWRKKVSELHPDKYSNLPASVQELIKQKAQELNRARELLRG